MAINLSKTSSTDATSGSPPQPAPQPQSSPVADPMLALRTTIAARVFDGYCEAALRTELVRLAVTDLGLVPAKAALLTDMALEAEACANEYRLCEELTGLLRRFTDKDKKLDPKERSDAIQMVCKPRSGYAKGLALNVAEALVTDFCRAHGVRQKVGMFLWAIP